MTVTIRHAEPSDYESLHAIYQGKKAIWGTLQLPYPSAESWRKRLSDPPQGLYTLVAEMNGEVVGTISLNTFTRPRKKHRGGIGMSVHDNWQGKGIGTALMEAVIDMADNWLQLRRLELSVFVDNEPAIGLYEKMGFEREGIMRDYAFRDGEYIDTLMMGRINPN